MLDLALTEWTKGTLQNHSREFPDVPYGIFNGPDCWSSKLAGSLEVSVRCSPLDLGR